MKFAALSAVFYLFFALTSTAQTYPEYTSTTVNDFAGLLSAEDIATLDERLNSLKTETGIEMTVVTLPSQTPYAPDITMEAFATGLFNHWGVGNAARNDGIMVLVLHEDRAMRVELGLGYDKSWDYMTQRVIDRDFLPSFRDGAYARGILRGTGAVIDQIALPHVRGAPPAETKGSPWGAIIGFGSMGIFMVLMLNIRRFGDMMQRLNACPSCGQKGGLRRRRVTAMMPTTTTAGMEEVVTTCLYCDYQDTVQRRLPRRARSNSSGRSGGSFGGGRSGGGGASGRW